MWYEKENKEDLFVGEKQKALPQLNFDSREKRCVKKSSLIQQKEGHENKV